MIENELKFVLSLSSIFSLAELTSTAAHIKQGYHAKGGRFRCEDSTKFTFNYKVALGHGADEFEMPISEQEFTRCYASCDIKLSKVRHTIRDDHYNNWDIDYFYNGDELYFAMAECELATEEKDLPEELLPFVAAYLVYAVPRKQTAKFSSKKLAEVSYAKELLSQINRGVLK